MPSPPETSRSAERLARLQARLAQRYGIERNLGRAGAVTVYLARDLATDHPVVLKVVDPAVMVEGSAPVLEHLRAAATVRHPRLTPLLDVDLVPTEFGDLVYYAAAPPAGETLRARLDREGQLPVGDALSIAEDVASGLSAAHTQGIAHGSLTPERVVLAGGRAIVDDLGVEHAVRQRLVDLRDDVAALGRLLYEMLSGAPPGDGGGPPLRAGRAGIPEDVELTVAQLLSPDAGRLRTAGDALAAIRRTVEATRVAPPGAVSGERLGVPRRVPARWSVFTFAVVGLLALSLWLRYRAPGVTPTPPPVRPGSIAVLPFVNATPDSGNLFLSEGIAREVTASLGRVPGLRVAGEASAFLLGHTRMAPRRAGERLGVDAVLQGTVRPSEGRLRIRAHLLSVREGFDLWSETYERDVAELPDVEREIVKAVTGALRFPPPPRATLAATSTAVHETYLRALGAGADSTRRALLEKSVWLDSSFAPAWTALAAARLGGSPHDTLRPAELARRVREAVGRALVLDSTSAEAHGILGELRFRYDWDWSGAEASLRRSIALNPNLPVSHLRLAHLLLVLGRVDESLEVARRALGLSPFDPVVRLYLARQALQLGDYVRAGEELDQVEARNPGVEGAELLRGLVLAATGRYPEAAVPLERAAADTTRSLEPLAVLGWVYALGGRREEARDIQVRLQEAATTRYVSPYLLAFLADALGDRRSAFAALDRAVELRAPELVNLRIDARMDRLRVDRRYDAVARRIGLP